MSGPRSTAAWRRARAACLARSTHCWLCGQALHPELRWPHPLSSSVDHVNPLHNRGALLDPANHRAAHLRCNIARGNYTRRGERHPGEHRPSREW